MADDLDQMFGDISEAPETPQPEPVEEQPQETPAEVPPPEPEVPEQPAPVAEERHVPLRTFLDQRDEAKEWKRRAEAAEAQARQAFTQQPLVDPYDDPEAFQAQMETKLEQRLTTQRFEISDQMAREKHGAETVDAATEWAQEKAKADPVFAAGYMRDKNPIDWIVQQHKRDAMLSEVGQDPVAYARKIAEREGWLTAAPATQVAAPPLAPKPAKVPQSLATQGSGPVDVGHIPSGPLVGLEVFK